MYKATLVPLQLYLNAMGFWWSHCKLLSNLTLVTGGSTVNCGHYFQVLIFLDYKYFPWLHFVSSIAKSNTDKGA